MGNDNESSSARSQAPGKHGSEESANKDRETSGRDDKSGSKAGRPAGGREASDSTGINPDDVDSVTGGPKMPPA